MKFEDYKKLRLEQEIWVDGKKFTITKLYIDRDIFRGVRLCFDGSPETLWSDIYQDCSLTKPEEKKKYSLARYWFTDTSSDNVIHYRDYGSLNLNLGEVLDEVRCTCCNLVFRDREIVKKDITNIIIEA